MAKNGYIVVISENEATWLQVKALNLTPAQKQELAAFIRKIIDRK